MVSNPFKRTKKDTNYDFSFYKSAPHRRKSRLEENFSQLETLLKKAEGRKIALIGQPGAGKSSLLLKLTNGKCEPKPTIGQGTDTTDWSSSSKPILCHQYDRIYFIDTPGYDTKAHPLKSYHEYFPFHCFDTVLFVIKGKVHQSDEEMLRLVMNKTRRTSTVVLVRGYAEDLTEEDRKSLEHEYSIKFKTEKHNLPFFFVSNRFGEGIAELQACLNIK
ncbi:GTPase domain-containing protein [Domibacillus robiginosus]|uniref:GTPase domain-containing protein n=1 Tax=Domibacillus robiginosus TaxID=1071054 RepID=UPI00067E22A4|nr:GTPase domain-containing protein [Domibacillus robiginosus]